MRSSMKLSLLITVLFAGESVAGGELSIMDRPLCMML